MSLELVWFLCNFMTEHGPLLYRTKVFTPQNGRPFFFKCTLKKCYHNSINTTHCYRA